MKQSSLDQIVYDIDAHVQVEGITARYREDTQDIELRLDRKGLPPLTEVVVVCYSSAAQTVDNIVTGIERLRLTASLQACDEGELVRAIWE